jgi:hypothetical protein
MLSDSTHVIIGLVPVIPLRKSAAFHSIGMAGTSPAMTPRVCPRSLRQKIQAATPSFFCRLVDEVVYWNRSFFSGYT